MLIRLRVKNFRLLRSITLDIAPGHPLVLIGPNSSGKSSVLDVLDILARTASAPLDKALAPFGHIFTIGATEPMEIEVFFGGIPTTAPDQQLCYGLRFDQAGNILREWAQLERTGEASHQLLSLDEGMDEAWIWNEKFKRKDPIDLDDYDRGSLAFLNFRKKKRSYPSLAEIGEELSSIQVYHGFPASPLWVRDVREGQALAGETVTVAPIKRMDRRGFELVNVLEHLRVYRVHEWKVLMNAFRREFPFVSKIECPADPGGGKIGLAWWDERFGDKRLYGYQMSEGMLTFLCLLVAILTPEPTAAAAFDEPDSYLHPSALRRLVTLLESASAHRAVILTTHSDRLLDYLSDPSASLRVCEASREGVSIKTLAREALEAWRQEYTLSALRDKHYLDQDNGEVLES